MKLMTRAVFAVSVMTMMTAFAPAQTPASAFHKASAKAFKAGVPKDFYLEGNAIPVEKYHTITLREGRGQVIIGLLATSGYSSRIQQKYLGMIITTVPVNIGGVKLGVGSYGFGLAAAKQGHDEFNVFNQAGAKLGHSGVQKDSAMPHPTPLQVIFAKDGSVHLYLGRFWVALRAE